MMAKCKCGAAEMHFKHIPFKDIDGKWECSKCKDNMAKKKPEPKAADINEDGKVDEKDLSLVHKEYAAEKKAPAKKKKKAKKKVVKKSEE